MYSEQATTGRQPATTSQGERLTLRSGKTLRVRPFNFDTRADYEDVVAIHNLIDPEFREAIESWQHWDRNRDPKLVFRRFIAERDGETVAYGSYGHMDWSFDPDRYFIWAGVHPDEQRKGYGSALWDYLLQRLSRRQPAELVSFTRENRPQAVEFLHNRGFEVRMREAISRINPQTFDVTPFAEKIARLAQSGVAVSSLAEIMERDPNWKRNMYELEKEAEKDVPSIGEVTKSAFEVYEKQVFGLPNLLPEGWFVAIDGDEYVGMSVLWRDLENSQRLETGFTGVKRSHRRRGIATALKARALEYARVYGATCIDTGNEENNPMLQLNYQLGFRPMPAELLLQKNLLTQSDAKEN
jgi:GNAT superfamily N-acetyltransferase